MAAYGITQTPAVIALGKVNLGVAGHYFRENDVVLLRQPLIRRGGLPDQFSHGLCRVCCEPETPIQALAIRLAAFVPNSIMIAFGVFLTVVFLMCHSLKYEWLAFVCATLVFCYPWDPFTLYCMSNPRASLRHFYNSDRQGRRSRRVSRGPNQLTREQYARLNDSILRLWARNGRLVDVFNDCDANMMVGMTPYPDILPRLACFEWLRELYQDHQMWRREVLADTVLIYALENQQEGREWPRGIQDQPDWIGVADTLWWTTRVVW